MSKQYVSMINKHKGPKKLSQEEFIERFNIMGHPDEIEILSEFKGFNLGKDGEIKCWCKKGQHEFYMNPTTLLQGYHCLECSYKERGLVKKKHSCEKLIKYIEDNDLKLTLESEYIDTKTKIHFRCGYCNNEWLVSPDKILQGRRCPFCNDGISFNNKLLRILFDILKPDNYDFEYGEPWNYNYMYDGYFTYQDENNIKREVLVEMDGEPHFRETSFKNRTLKDNIKIDKEKDNLAQQGNYILIRILCYGTDKQTVEILRNSELKNILDFSNINWDEVFLRAEKSLIIEVCEYYKNNSFISKKELAKHFKLGLTTIQNYVKTGLELGLLTEDILKNNSKYTYNFNNNEYINGRAILVYSDFNLITPIHLFKSFNDCSRYYKIIENVILDRHEISKMLSGKRKYYKGLYFKYATSQDLLDYKNLMRDVDKSINVY